MIGLYPQRSIDIQLIWSILMHSNINSICRVCGFRYDNYYPWGEDGKSPSFDICDCCGTEFGYQDCNIDAIRAKREKWIEEGAKWDSLEIQPINWSLEESLMRIPEIYK